MLAFFGLLQWEKDCSVVYLVCQIDSCLHQGNFTVQMAMWNENGTCMICSMAGDIPL